MATVITNVALVLDKFHTLVHDNHITGVDLPVVYNDALDFQQAIADYRAKNKIEDKKISADPLFIYTREVLRWSENKAPGRRRFLSTDLSASLPYHVDLFRSAFGEMVLRFMFSAPNARELEQFEVAYLTGEGVGKVKQMDVGFPGFADPLPYYLHWEPLEAKEIVVQESYHKTVTGGVRVEGWYFVLRDEDSPSPIIAEVNGLIHNPDYIIMSTLQEV